MANKKQISLDEEMLMFTSYRYCIGRKTYVTSLAPYIGKKYYPLLSEERAEFTAQDIRKSIADCLRFNTPSFEYEGSVFDNQRNALADYLTWLNDNNIQEGRELMRIKRIVCYKESYREDAPKVYDVQTSGRTTRECYESDFTDLLTWETLASLFDKKKHKWITVNYEGKEERIECFETWKKAYKHTNDGYLTPIAWRYEKAFVSVNRYLEKGDYCGYLDEQYITKIENYE